MADIALNDWINFKDKMARLSQTAADKFSDYINSGGGYSNMNIEDIVGYATALVQKYGEGEGALAAMMYDAIAELSGAAVPPAEIAPLPTYGDVAKAIQGAAKTSELSGYLGAVAGRLVKQVGADTTLQNAERDGAQFAWIPMGDTCAFCLTLASRGWQYMSKNAMKNGHAEHIHANCDCQYAVRFDKNTNVEGYDPDKYSEMYYNAEGNTPKERINSMRREFYAKNKINGLKNLESSAAEEANVGLPEALAGVYERRRIAEGLRMTPYAELSGSSFNPVSVDIGSLSDKTQNSFESTIARLSTSYDTSLMKVRTMTSQEALGNTAFATTRHNYSAGSAEMIINPLKCKDYDNMTGRISELRKSGYIPRIKAGSEGDYLATHEFAHTLLNIKQPVSEKTNFVNLDLPKIKRARKEITDVYERYVESVGALEANYKKAELDIITGASNDVQTVLNLKKKLDDELISRYSLLNVDEFMAEAFSDSEIGESPKAVSTEVASILKKYFGAK